MSAHESGPPPGAAQGRLRDAAPVAALVALWLPAILDAGAVGEAAALRALADGPAPYFRPEHALLLWVRFPLAVVGACALFVAPGLLFAIRTAARDGSGDATLLRGFAWSVVWNAVVVAAASLAGPSLGGAGWALLQAGLAAPLAVACLVRPVPRGALPAQAGLLSLGACALLAAALAPKFLWESFNGDGAHAYESARQLLHRPVPFFAAEAGGVASFPGTTSMAFAYPGAWFVRLFGEFEASARIPALLSLAGLHAAVFAAAQVGARRAARTGERLAIWACAAVYLVAMGFSATYCPYSADLSLPATQDTLLLAAFAGFVWASAADRPALGVLFAILTHTSLPSGAVLMASWLAARALLERPLPKRALAHGALALVVAVAFAAAVPRICAAAHLPVPGSEYASAGLAVRLSRLQFVEAGRVLWAAVPAGLLPFAAMFAWRRLDTVARAVVAVAAVQFVFIYVQAYVSLHHFAPVMALPWIVFARLALAADGAPRTRLLAACGASAAVAMVLALPPSARPYTLTGRIGRTIADTAGGYATAEPAAYARIEMMSSVFPMPYDVRVPADGLGISPIAWAYYANRPASERTATVYRIEPADAPPAPGADVRAEAAGARLVVTDAQREAADRALRPPTPPAAPALDVPRSVLYRGIDAESRPWVIELGPRLRALLRRDG